MWNAHEAPISIDYPCENERMSFEKEPFQMERIVLAFQPAFFRGYLSFQRGKDFVISRVQNFSATKAWQNISYLM